MGVRRSHTENGDGGILVLGKMGKCGGISIHGVVWMERGIFRDQGEVPFVEETIHIGDRPFFRKTHEHIPDHIDPRIPFRDRMFVPDETIIGVPFFPALMNPVISKGVTGTFRGESEQVIEFWESLFVPSERGGPRVLIVGLAERKEIT
jgi:hypothetical protein